LSVASSVCAAILTFSSCADNGVVNPGQKEFEQNFVKEFGVPDKNHNWSMADGHMAHVNLPSGFNGHVRLYTSLPGSDDCRMLANIKVKDGKANEPFLVPCDINKVFVLISDCPNVYTFAGYLPLDGVDFNIDDSNDGGRAVDLNNLQAIEYYYTLRDLFVKPFNSEYHEPKDRGQVNFFESEDRLHSSLVQGNTGTMTQRELWNIIHHNTEEDIAQQDVVPLQPDVFRWGGLGPGGNSQIGYYDTYFGDKYGKGYERISLCSLNETGAIPLEICVSTLHEHYGNVKIGYFCYEEMAECVFRDKPEMESWEKLNSALTSPASVFAFFNETPKYVVYENEAIELWNSPVIFDEQRLTELQQEFENYYYNPENPKPEEPVREEWMDEQTYNDMLAAYQEDLKRYEKQYQIDWNNYKKENSYQFQTNSSVSYAKMEPDWDGKTYPSLQEVAEMTREQADASDVTYNTVTIQVPGDGRHYGLFMIGDNKEIVTSDMYFNSLLHRESADFYKGLIECAIHFGDKRAGDEYSYIGFGLESGHQDVMGVGEPFEEPPYSEWDERRYHKYYSDGSGRDALDIVFRIPVGEYPITEPLPYPNRPEQEPQFVDWIIACEDLGGTDDFDFNDVVLSYSFNNGLPTLTLLAAGGTLDTEIYVKGNLWGEVHELFGVQKGTMVNTGRYTVEELPQLTLQEGYDYNYDEIHYEIDGDLLTYSYIPHIQLRTIRDDHDGYAIIYDSQYLKDKNYEQIAPTAMVLKGGWRWPNERCHINDAYPSFPKWVGNKDYYGAFNITEGVDVWTESEDVRQENICAPYTVTLPDPNSGQQEQW